MGLIPKLNGWERSLLLDLNYWLYTDWGCSFTHLVFVHYLQHVGWWSPTIVRGEDREAVHIPNHKFTVNVVRNLSQKSHWRIKTHLAISHLDVHKINVRRISACTASSIRCSCLPLSHWITAKVYCNKLWSYPFVQNIVADMRKVLAKNPQVEQQRLHRRVFLDNINPENQALLVSVLEMFLFFFFKS